MQEQHMAVGFGIEGSDHVGSNPVGVDGYGPRMHGRVRHQALGNGRESPMLLDRQLAMIAVLDQPTQTKPHQLGSDAHLTRCSFSVKCQPDGSIGSIKGEPVMADLFTPFPESIRL